MARGVAPRIFLLKGIAHHGWSCHVDVRGGRMSPTKIFRPRSPSRVFVAAAWVAALTLPLVGLCSLLLRSRLDPTWDGSRFHFVLFLAVGGAAFLLAYVAGQAADRRGDARVFLLSLGFLVTGGFLAVHAIGTPGVLVHTEHPGFTMAIPIGLLFASLFVCASAFVDVRPRAARAVARH